MSSELAYHERAEAYHTIQNPMSPEKLDRLIEYLELHDGDRLVDVGSGKGWLLHRIASRYSVQAVGLDVSAVFIEDARRRLAETPLKGSVEIVERPALAYAASDQSFDVALCIGATFAFEGLAGTAAWMARVTKPGGRIAIGEPFARRPFPPDVAKHWPEYDRTLAELVEAIAAQGFTPTGLITSSDADWDHYESQHWRAGLAWLRANAGHADAIEFGRRLDNDRRAYLTEERDVFGWAIVAAERTAPG